MRAKYSFNPKVWKGGDQSIAIGFQIKVHDNLKKKVMIAYNFTVIKWQKLKEHHTQEILMLKSDKLTSELLVRSKSVPPLANTY